MTRADAIKKAHKFFGKGGGIRINNAVSRPEDREAARIKADVLRAECERLKQERAEVYKAAGLPELDKQLSALQQARHKASIDSGYYRCAVGAAEFGMFFIKVEGDSWEDCFRKLEAARERAAIKAS